MADASWQRGPEYTLKKTLHKPHITCAFQDQTHQSSKQQVCRFTIALQFHDQTFNEPSICASTLPCIEAVKISTFLHLQGLYRVGLGLDTITKGVISIRFIDGTQLIMATNETQPSVQLSQGQGSGLKATRLQKTHSDLNQQELALTSSYFTWFSSTDSKMYRLKL